MKESARWLRLIRRVPLLTVEAVGPLLSETDELMRIFASRIRTAKGNAERRTLNVERGTLNVEP